VASQVTRVQRLRLAGGDKRALLRESASSACDAEVDWSDFDRFIDDANEIRVNSNHSLDAAKDSYWALCALVDSIERWEILRADVSENGYTTKNVAAGAARMKGKLKEDEEMDETDMIERVRPTVRLLFEVQTLMRYWLQEFGLTDVTFAKAPKKSSAPKPGNKNPLSDYGLAN